MDKNRFFTVVYEVPDDWRPGDDIMHNPMMTSVSWSHALRDRDEALARAGIAAPTGRQAEPVAPGALKAAIVASLNKWETEMEGYSYFGSNPGVKRDDYEDIADEVVAAMSAAQAQPKDTTDTKEKA